MLLLVSDYNATVVAIDSGIECFDRIRDASSQFHRIVCYDLSQLEAAISDKISHVESRINDIYDQINALYSESQESAESNSSNNIEAKMRSLNEEAELLQSKLDALEALMRRCRSLSMRYHSQSQPMLSTISTNVSEGIRSMSTYLRKIQSIEGIPNEAGTSRGGFTNPFSGETNYAVVFIDSAKYPETAEHIETAIRCGAPASLTLDRPGANNNRLESLQGIPVRQGYDRDEYPMACFSEGGSGSHVFYLSPSDNRGSGSSISHQLRNIPDGTIVRFRII